MQSRTTNIVTQPSNEGDNDLVGDTDGQGFGIGLVSGRVCSVLVMYVMTGSTGSQAKCVTCCCHEEDEE